MEEIVLNGKIINNSYNVKLNIEILKYIYQSELRGLIVHKRDIAKHCNIKTDQQAYKYIKILVQDGLIYKDENTYPYSLKTTDLGKEFILERVVSWFGNSYKDNIKKMLIQFFN